MIASYMNTATTPGRITTVIALIALVSVMAVFFFPAVQGPYSAVHGPVTVFHAARAAAGFRMTVVRAGLNSIRGHCRSTTVVLPWTADLKTEFRPVPFAGCNPTLRC